MPYIDSKYIFPLLVSGIIILITYKWPGYFNELLNGDFSDKSDASNASDYLFQTPAVKIATIIFWLVMIVLAVISFLKNLSLIPLLGLVSCLYLLTGMSGSNWKWFFVWFAIGLVIYLSYGYHKSKLAPARV